MALEESVVAIGIAATTLAIVLLGAVLPLWALRRAKRRHGRKGVRTHLGSVRIGGLYASLPTGSLAISASELAIGILGREHRFPRESIDRLVREPGLLSRGFRLEHHREGEPPDVCFWTLDHGDMYRDLDELGYEVRD